MVSPNVRSMARAASLALLALAALSLGCDTATDVGTPPSFERPGALTFVCFDSTSSEVVPLDRCEGLEGTSEETNVLTALVVQTARGEVAAIDLRRRVVLDSDPRVPGYTFVRVGEVPTGLVVPPAEPRLTYVASLGSRLVQWLPTAGFRNDAIDSSGAVAGSVALSDGPMDLVLSPDGAFLYAPLPMAHSVAQLRLGPDGEITEVIELPLDGALPSPLAAMAPGVYGKTCPPTARLEEPELAAARAPDPAGLSPRPVRAHVDAESDPPVLLIADGALPLVHRFTLDASGATAIAPLHAGAPLRDLVVSPTVPAEIGLEAASAPSRYLYAIDAEDGSILVMDYEPSSPDFGAVLSVTPAVLESDRITLSASARTLEIVQRGYPGFECVPGSEEEASAGPTQLRGVFLAVGLADGSVRFLDVFDLDASCRGGDASCSAPANELDVEIYLRRHRPRIASLIQEAIALSNPPTMMTGGAPVQIGPGGAPLTGDAFGLLPLATCPSGMSQAYPPTDQGDALVCLGDDPWTMQAEIVSATWEASLPGARGGRGRLAAEHDVDGVSGVAGDWLISDELSFCALGAIGSGAEARLGDTEPEQSYAGDQLRITSELPPDAPAGCEAFAGDAQSRSPIGFAILESHASGLRLGDPYPAGGASFAEVQRCFRELVGFEIRARGAYLVQGALSGVSHRIVANAEGRCVVDPARPYDPLRPRDRGVMRALPGRPYQGRAWAFALQGDVPIAGARAVLSFGISDVPIELGLNLRLTEAGSTVPAIVEALVLGPTDSNLYAVDAHGERVVQIALDPLRPLQLYR